MSDPTAPPATTPFRYSLRGLLGALALAAVVLAAYGWYYRHVAAPRSYSRQIDEMILSLARRRPANMTRGQWGSAVAWTSNLHANSLVVFEADPPAIKAFHRRLEQKLSGPVDMATIHWIWDEYAALTPHGADYQRFKPMMLEEIAAVGPNTDIWQMNAP